MSLRRKLTSATVLVASLTLITGLQMSPAESATKKKKAKPTTTRKSRVKLPPITTVATGSAPVATAAVVPATSSIVWTACGTFECAAVPVPIDYGAPTGPSINIALKRVKATNPNAKSILINPGGPSGSGIELVENFPTLFTPSVRADFHIIGFDPRGVRQSAALPCGSTRDRDARTGQQYIAAIKDACFNRAPDLVKSISTANTARDLDLIRAALGEEKLNYYGISYGTYLGLVYADLFPTRVGRFIIDSAVDPKLRAIELTVGQYAVYEQVLLDFMARCEASRDCPFRPGSLARYDKLLNQLAQRPVQSDRYSIGRSGLESITLNLIRGGQEPLLARALTEFENRNGSSINEIVTLFDSGLPDINDLISDPDSDGMYFQVACSEGFHPSASPDSPNAKLALFNSVAPRFLFSSTGAAGSQVCPFWGQQVDRRPQPQPRPGVPPILFTGSKLDSVTPIVWTRTVASQWPGSVLVEIPGSAHGATLRSACLTAVASTFILTGQLPPSSACPTR